MDPEDPTHPDPPRPEPSSALPPLGIDLAPEPDQLATLARPAPWCHATDPVAAVARLISSGGHSCALVRTAAGVGIVTDHDFRGRVATGDVPLDAPITALATAPVRSIPQHTTRSAALLRMLEHGVHHLALTDPAGAITGVVRAVDLAAPQVRDPLRTRARIDTATTIDELATAASGLPATLADLHQHRLDVEHIAAMHTALVDAIVRQVLRLQPPPALSRTRHTWLLLGSMARREPLPSSDLDTALIWDDAPRTGADQQEAAESIRAGAARVLETLRRCGLRTCLAGTNADNPTFSRPRSQWRAATADWRHDPHPDTLLMAAMLTDARPLTDPQLAKDLRPPPPRGNTRYPRAVLTEALGFRPPTGFVRGFVVEHTGEHRGQLDLKKGGLAPVVALARWVAMVCGAGPASTPARLRLGAEHHLLTTDEAQALTGAWRETYGLVLEHELAAIRAGGDPTTFIAPRRLDSLTRRHLRDTFRLIRSIQARLDEHWLARLERANLHTGQR